MRCFDKETNSTPKTAAEAKALLGKRVKYLQEQDIDRSGRGLYFPRYGTVTGNKGKNIVIADVVVKPAELVILAASDVAPGMQFTMLSVTNYLSAFGNVIRNRIGTITAVNGNGREVRATWAPKTTRGRVTSGTVEIEDIKVITEPAAAPVVTKPARKPRIKDTEFYVQITEKSTRTAVELRGPFPDRKAEKLCSGMSINLNHNRFSAAVVPKSKVKPETLKACGK